jgi:hypothetical protein
VWSASESCDMVALLLPFVNRRVCLLSGSFEWEGRIRMGVTEVEEFEGVGWGVMGLLRLWKCVEKWERE